MYVSHSRGIYCAFSHCYINVRKKFNSYKNIIPFNSKIKSKNQRLHRKKKLEDELAWCEGREEPPAQCSKF